MEENTVCMLGVPLFTHDGYEDAIDDCIQYKALEWKLKDMEKYNGKYAALMFDGSLQIYELEGKKLFDGSLLDSVDFVTKLKEKIN